MTAYYEHPVGGRYQVISKIGQGDRVTDEIFPIINLESLYQSVFSFEN